MSFPDFPDYGKERPNNFPAFETLLSRLSPPPELVATHPEQLSPLRPELIDIEGVRTSLKDAGHRLEITRDEIQILRETQFRSLDQGRGRSVQALMGSFPAQEMMAFIFAITQDKQRRIVSRTTGAPIEGSQGRGLRHFIADTFLLVAEPSYVEAYCRTLNRRALKGLLTAGEFKNSTGFKQVIRAAFNGVEDKTDNPKFIGIPPGTLVPTWQFLIAKRDRF